MNCYYSKLIEDLDTHPIDIERALNNDYDNRPEQRNLQLDVRLHTVPNIIIQIFLTDEFS